MREFDLPLCRSATGSRLKRKGRILIYLFATAMVLLVVCFITTYRKPVVYLHQENSGKRWFRGNTHTHTKFLDILPSHRIPVVASWYRRAGYDFLSITDHNTNDGARKVICHNEVAEPPVFIMLCGLELSRKTHLTGLGIDRYIDAERSLQDGVSLITGAGGVPILNHPAFPQVTTREFIAAKGLKHLEVYNGKRPSDTRSSEMLWDSILSAPDGRIVYAIAADDCHNRRRKAVRGWIMVESPSLTAENIIKNIRDGNFYASTGVFLKDYKADRNEIMINTENGKKIIFTGWKGEVLSSTDGPAAKYKPTGDEHYIRIKVTGADGIAAWTQPLFIN